ncbi:armadillo repeat-containing protein 6 [Citrus clementina]|uniref:armadillo repeat-containing protein 6 n=1 Tax=Citrus clementina TaxID=85681 RepID=UPI000CED0ABA|nr:armadillo repeat-containing protein 6 [Citrus x clementina]
MEENASNPVVEVSGEGKGESIEGKDGPPVDDCCPICFGDFTIPCKANCGHWYCANCILQFWNYSSASKPCKCPMCSRYINRLTPESSLSLQQEQEVAEVLKKVVRYNLLFVGGARGLVQKVYELPFFMKRIFVAMMDPDTEDSYLQEMRIFAMALSVLYAATPFDFIPTGSLGIVRVFDYAAITLVLILRLIGIYRRRRLTQRMGPPNTVRTISQEAFDEVVKENMEDLGMEPTEALQDAIQTLSLQGVDLSGIVKCVPGESSLKDNPLIQSLERLKQLDLNSKDKFSDEDLNEMMGLFDKLIELCGGNEGSVNAAVATKNGGVELVCSICYKMRCGSKRVLDSCLKTMALLVHDVQSTETFRTGGGPKLLVNILIDGNEDPEILNSGFAVVAASATGNEVVKESYMELKIDELILEILSRQRNDSIQSLYDAIRVLLTPDDDRVVASQVYGYAGRFAKIGIARALVHSLHAGLSSPSLISASIALKAVAVNDEICKSVAENGGIDALLRCIDDSGLQGNKTVARICCSLLSKLAGSDSNKSAIIENGGMDKLIVVSARFSDDASVLQEVMSIITVLSLRSPENAARAMEAGSGDLAIQAMLKFPNAQQLQRSSCFMIRNLVARNPENRKLLLSNGVEKLIRQAKENHEICKDAATDALRDLGLDDYNK